MLDPQITKEIQDWLASTNPDIPAGATLLLRLDGNRFLYRNIIASPAKMLPKLTYELRKHLMIRLDGLTTAQVAALDKEVEQMPIPEKVNDSPLYGKRTDHDSLPPKVQEWFSEAHALLLDMRSIHEKLKLMKSEKPCDRYPWLKEMVAKHRRRRQLFALYDNYDPTTEEVDQEQTEAKDGGGDGDEKSVATRKVIAARTYISQGKARLAALISQGRDDEAADLRNKLATRLALLAKVGSPVGQAVTEELEALGVAV